MKTERLGLYLGFLIAAIFAVLGYYYFEYRDRMDSNAKSQGLFGFMEASDQRFNDFKYQFRGVKSVDSPVALVAIDDDSLRQMGRWPWRREMMADLTQQLLDGGVKSIAFDMIFSEADDKDPVSDRKLAQLFENHSQRLILGVFSENLSPHFRPYQDYCVAEAFLRTGGADIVKPMALIQNAEGGVEPNLIGSFIVDDQQESPFDTLNWSDFFALAFSGIEKKTEAEFLSSLNKKGGSQLNQHQKNLLVMTKSKNLFQFCENWEPRFDDSPDLQRLYLEIFHQSEALRTKNYSELITALKTSVPRYPIPQYGEWTPNISLLQKQSQYTASFIVKQDSDGYIRRYPLFFRSGKKLASSFIPSLALQSFLLAKGYRAEVTVGTDSQLRDTKKITAFSIWSSSEPATKIMDIPVSPSGEMLIDYLGEENLLPRVSAKEFFNDSEKLTYQIRVWNSMMRAFEVESRTVDKAEFLKDRSIIIGATAIGLSDHHNTPIGIRFPGPEIHLTVLSNLLQGRFLKRWSKINGLLAAGLFFMGLLFSWAVAYTSPLKGFFVFHGFLGLVLFGDVLLFSVWSYKTSSLIPLIQCVFTYFSITLLKYYRDERRKKQIRSTFSKYVSPAIVDELLENPDNVKLGGRKQRMTAYFSDIRGFTTMSEKMSPDQVMVMLNRYLTPMTKVVYENNGTIDKYMGDAIMAFFGAPIWYPNHATMACRCALQSIEALIEIQRQLVAEGLPAIDVGIGINTGEMSVGNMGSEMLQNYTVLGDAVNLASRLESINRKYGTRIVISEYTYEDVKEQFVAREIDKVRVKGKTIPIRIFELMREGTLTDDELEHLSYFNTAYEEFYKRNFERAKELFRGALQFREEDPVVQFYIARAEEFLKNPPPPDWDGVSS